MYKSALAISLGLSPWLVACGESSSEQPGGAGTGQASGGSSSAGAGNSDSGSKSGAAGSSSPGGNTSGGSASGGSAGSAAGGSAGSATTPTTEKFSFFVTSLKAMVQLSGSEEGFGGDLTFGETGDGAGLRGADKICTTIAEKSLPGNGKTWRAFLSATRGEDGAPVNAIDRIGEGPWYDRTGRLVAENKTDLATTRPTGADSAIVNDLPNEDGVPNHAPDANADEVDNHDILTGTNEQGKLFSTNDAYTCKDWTSSVGTDGTPHCGHSWPRAGFGGGGGKPGGGGFGSGENWMSALNEAGCAPGAYLIEAGPPGANGTKSVGDGGGYGGIYCFALTP
jgi:hypothetical protein